MKIQAISNHERATIIAHLSKHPLWKAERLGASVEIARFTPNAKTGEAVLYSVTMAGARLAHARADTVFDACEDINDMIDSHRTAPPPPAGRVADPTRTGTPHLVRRARHAGAEERSGRLW
jgi:hypothetical protein